MAEPAFSRVSTNTSSKSLTFLFTEALFDIPEQPNSPILNDPSIAQGELLPPPDANDWWLKAVIQNYLPNSDNNADSVTLTLQANLSEASDAYIRSVAFNLTDAFANVSVCTGTAAPCVEPNFDYNYNPGNIVMANGINGLDLRLNFPESNAPNSNRFDKYDTLSFIITGDGLDYMSFLDSINVGGEPVFAAAKLEGYNDDLGGGSSTIYSAPGPLPLLGLAAAFRTSRRLRRRLTSARPASGRPPAYRPA